MSHVIRTIEILPIPTRRESERGHNSLFTFAFWESDKLRCPGHESIKAGVSQLAEACSLIQRPGLNVADEHPEALNLLKVVQDVEIPAL
jgi:hypothetical protein